MSFRYFMINKPYGMESQFISKMETALLGDLAFDFPEGIHAVGRLDKHSEGLLLLTTDKRITRLLFQSKDPHARTYLVQVKHKVGEEALKKLQSGLVIRIKGGDYYQTPACDVRLVDPPPKLFPLPFFVYEFEETSWLLITLTEGRYHQVRKMVASAGHKCRRLIRVSIEDLSLGDLPPGGVKELSQQEFYTKLRLGTVPDISHGNAHAKSQL